MKNTYDHEILDLAYQRFLMLKKNEEYQSDYYVLNLFKKQTDKYKGNDKQIRDVLIKAYFECWADFCKKWHLCIPINPSLKLSKDSIYKSIRQKSGLARFIYAFHIGSNSNLITLDKPKITVTGKTKELDKQAKKALCYMLCEVSKRFGKTRYRQLGRILGIDKDTAKKWCREYEDLSKNEKKLLLEEVCRGRRFPDIDVSDRYYKTMTSISKLGDFLDEKGSIVTTHQKRRPRITE